MNLDYVGTCWLTTAIGTLLFFMIILLIMSTVTNDSFRVPRCVPKEEISNETIHLVHVKYSDNWHPFEVDLFERIVKNYPKYKIRLIQINEHIPSSPFDYPKKFLDDESVKAFRTATHGTTVTTTDNHRTTKGGGKRKKRKMDDMRLSINMSAKRLLDILLHGKATVSNGTEKFELIPTPQPMEKTTERIKTVDDLLEMYPNVILENTTYNQLFFMSPLYGYWPFLNENLRIFAVRVLQLWQYGGISFDLCPKHIETKTNLNKTNVDSILNKKLLSFIISEKKNYEQLPSGVVTADDEALHMESKIPCHAFFGEILIKLRQAEDGTTVKQVLQDSLQVFCKHSAANKKYCDIITKA